MTEEQAREKIYRDLIEKGDIAGAKMMRRYQDYVHPLGGAGTRPKASPNKAQGKDQDNCRFSGYMTTHYQDNVPPSFSG
jgi:hypothetical protein